MMIKKLDPYVLELESWIREHCGKSGSYDPSKCESCGRCPIGQRIKSNKEKLASLARGKEDAKHEPLAVTPHSDDVPFLAEKTSDLVECCESCGRPFYPVGYCNTCGRPFYNPVEDKQLCGSYPEGWSSPCMGQLIVGKRPSCEGCSLHVNSCGAGHEEVFLCSDFTKVKEDVSER